MKIVQEVSMLIHGRTFGHAPVVRLPRRPFVQWHEGLRPIIASNLEKSVTIACSCNDNESPGGGSSKMAQAVTLLKCVQKVPGADLGRNTDYSG
jgi:hypothetical protein